MATIGGISSINTIRGKGNYNLTNDVGSYVSGSGLQISHRHSYDILRANVIDADLIIGHEKVSISAHWRLEEIEEMWEGFSAKLET